MIKKVYDLNFSKTNKGLIGVDKKTMNLVLDLCDWFDIDVCIVERKENIIKRFFNRLFIRGSK